MTKRQILVMGDISDVCCPIRERMENYKTNVHCTNSVTEALDLFLKCEYCLVIMEFLSPQTDGLDLLRVIRETRHTPILAITPPLNSHEKIALFQAGVSAFIEKPIEITVCMAQAENLIGLYMDSDDEVRRYQPIIFGKELIISQLYWQVIIDGTPLALTRTEFDLLFCLAQHQGQVWSRGQLYNHIWGDALSTEGENTVRTHIGNLRKKLADVGKKYIQTVRGIGYKFVPPSSK